MMRCHRTIIVWTILKLWTPFIINYIILRQQYLGVPNGNLILGNTLRPYKRLCNPSFHFMFHFLFRLSLR